MGSPGPVRARIRGSIGERRAVLTRVTLTDRQEQVRDADPNFLLLACPGSGKTQSVAARVARLDRAGVRVAACSYTNVGADRIAALLARDYSLLLDPRHFNGTLHRLLLHFVVYPFAHLVGGARPIRLKLTTWRDFPYKGDQGKRLTLAQFRRLPDGSVRFAYPDTWAKKHAGEIEVELQDQIISWKSKAFERHGVVSADDAMWLALRVLEEHPAIASAIARRFGEILVDEAQDTSDLQLACLKLLHCTGELKSLALVGDLEQSIYEYQGASAEACQKLAEDCGLARLELRENHRSSQKLCAVAAHFCGRPADEAVGGDRDCDIDPEILVYPSKDPTHAVTRFVERLQAHEVPPDRAAILARTNSMVHRLGGEQPVRIGDHPRDLGRAASALVGGRLQRSHVQAVERLLAYSAYGLDPDDVDEAERSELFRVAHCLFGRLPELDGDLYNWIADARAACREAVVQLTASPEHAVHHLIRSAAQHKTRQAADVFPLHPPDLTPQTVHALKGEDREAVMVVVKRPHGSDPANQLELFSAAIAGEEIVSPTDREERRVTYVAMTRAERYCLLALPDTKRGLEIAESCESIGFVRV